MALRMVSAGESHGPALAAIVTGLPAGLRLEKRAIDADLRRRQQGYGRSPRQKLESDEVEVLSGLRHGLTLGTPLTLVVRNRDHRNWTWGMSPWPPEGEPSGKGTKPVTLPRPGHADLAGVLKYGHDDVRNALERASARHTAVHVAAGAVAKALLGELGIAVAGRPVEIGGETTDDGMRDATDAARKERDTLGGIVEVVATGVPPGLGSYAEKGVRLDARLAAALMGIQAVKGVELGDGFALARRRGTEAHDEIDPGLSRRTNRAGGIEAGVSNGEPIVVRAAMKPLPTLMRPLDSVDLDTGEPAQALVERSDVQAVEALAVVAEAAVAFELARGALDKLGGDAMTDVRAAYEAYLGRIGDRWRPRTRTRSAGISRSRASWGRARADSGSTSRPGSAARSSTSTGRSRHGPARASPTSSGSAASRVFARSRKASRSTSSAAASRPWLPSGAGRCSPSPRATPFGRPRSPC
jgi:chorismate synthase